MHPFIQKVFSTPAVLPFSAALTPQAIRHKRMPQGLVSNNMVIISHYLRACQLQHWSEIEKKKKRRQKQSQPVAVECRMASFRLVVEEQTVAPAPEKVVVLIVKKEERPGVRETYESAG